MPVTLDFSTDYTVWDNPEQVSYYPRTSESAVTYGPEVVVTHAVREVGRKDERGPGGALLTQATTAWHIAQEQMPNTTPKAGDKLVDPSGVAYVVQPGLEYESQLTQCWRLPVQVAV